MLELIQAERGPFVAAVEATRVPMVVTDSTIDGNPIIYANQSFFDLCGYDREQTLGQNYFFLISAHTDPAAADRVVAAMSDGQRFLDDVLFQGSDGRQIWVSMFVSPVFEGGKIVQHFASFIDVTDRVLREQKLREDAATLERRVISRTSRLQQANDKLKGEVDRRRRMEATLRDALAQGQEDLKYRDFLVREVNHRTKNAMQLAMSLLAVQARRADPDVTVRDALETAIGRLQRIAEVHQLLTYQEQNSDQIDFREYLPRLCHEMADSLAPTSKRVVIEVNADEEALWSPDLVVPLGLIVGEAVTNALKHAFPGEREGRILVSLRGASPGLMQLQIADDGVGMPQSSREGSLGLRLMDMFAKQIGGTAKLGARTFANGTVVTVMFPDPLSAAGEQPNDQAL